MSLGFLVMLESCMEPMHGDPVLQLHAFPIMGIEKKNVARMFEQETLILETNAVIMKLDI